MLHLGECYYKLWWSNGVISNECSIKQSSPKANLARYSRLNAAQMKRALLQLSLKSAIISPSMDVRTFQTVLLRTPKLWTFPPIDRNRWRLLMPPSCTGNKLQSARRWSKGRRGVKCCSTQSRAGITAWRRRRVGGHARQR